MKYKVGQKLFKPNKRTGEIDEITITEILYSTSGRINNKCLFTEDDLDELEENGTISLDKDIVKRNAIEKVEKQFGIKLKEV